MAENTTDNTPAGRGKPGGGPVRVAVLLPDPRLPYDFGVDGTLGETDLEAVDKLDKALSTLDGFEHTLLDDHLLFIDRLRDGDFDIALNFCDTGFYNIDLQGNVPSLCEIFKLPCTGSPAVAIDAAGDKFLVAALAANLDIPVPEETFVNLERRPYPEPDDYPVLIKPNVGGGSYGVTRHCIVSDAEEAQKYMEWLYANVVPREALIQEFLTGREITVSVLGNPATGLEILPPAEVDYSHLDPELPPIFTYGAKFDPESLYWNQIRHKRAEVDDETMAWLEYVCSRLFSRLRCRDYARFDFRANRKGTLKLLDANPNPTWHWDGRLAMSAEWAGYSYADLLRKILEAGLSRYW